MPFNGGSHDNNDHLWDHVRILETIKQQYPDIQKVPDAPYSTSYNYHIPGHKGNVGIIAAYTRSFCGTCNRLRITPQGTLKTCLYDSGVLNIKELLRSGAGDESIMGELNNAIGHRAQNGWEAEKRRGSANPVHESMTTIGG
jgi:cyclic pyranopterin phosphate synthase